ncbi:hypothetical protein [Dyadobacter sandarakinus]|uniref:Uncharacterized protein n=1 Tax=Dyadobacter sandarakinus TaxID=2747268 RepID=A0ABX7IFB4_9BACT|nr:hypothetical protein [Dyadobacter sandarakinus]QRR03783.1 hypothetical protein HWI92_24155 [Dyadobacter sandarakinus]
MKLYKWILLSALAGVTSCDDQFDKQKYDFQLSVVNKTSSIIPKVRIDGANGRKTWTLTDLPAGETKEINVNIRRDLGVPEGGFIITAYLSSTDSVTLNSGYFTNWQYQGPQPARFGIYSGQIRNE